MKNPDGTIARMSESILSSIPKYEVVVVGAGIAGLTTAALLQKEGIQTLLLEAHDKVGGCAGYFFHKGYTFDAGATVIIGLDPEGLHSYVFQQLGVAAPESTLIECVTVHLPDRTVNLWHDQGKWERERVERFARTPDEARRLADFWKQVDTTADVLWQMTAKQPVLPIRGIRDLISNLRLVSPDVLWILPTAISTFDDILRRYQLSDQAELRAFLDGLLLITTQETAERAPFYNAAAGIDLYRHGIRRARGGMKTLVRTLLEAYRSHGGTIKFRQKVTEIEPRSQGGYVVKTREGLMVEAKRVVANIPVWNVPQLVKADLDASFSRALKKADVGWGAFTLYLGVDESVIPPDSALNHQVLQRYGEPFKDANSCFLSLSESGDLRSAPAGKRTLVVSTHTEVSTWYGLSLEDYTRRKQALTEQTLAAIRKVFPDIDRGLEVVLPGTPVTFENYTSRERGMVGGLRTQLTNSNLLAISSDIGLNDFWLVGDTTFPGQGTMACTLSGINAWRDICKRR